MSARAFAEGRIAAAPRVPVACVLVDRRAPRIDAPATATAKTIKTTKTA